VELFAGGAAISFGRNEKNKHLVDINGPLISFYHALSKGRFPIEPRNVTKEMYHNRRDRFNATLTQHRGVFEGIYPIQEYADDFYFLNKFGFNGLYRTNCAGVFNVPWNQKSFVAYPDFAPYQTFFTQGDSGYSTAGYENAKLEPSDLLFADPPYDGTFSSYAAEGFDWAAQVALAHWLDDKAVLGFPVVATNAATSRILSLYKDLGFVTFTIEAPRRVAANGDRSKALEMVAHRGLIK
jgi:DNA adenine methylase